jgi:tRNA(Arg) A34 adenosine deaminase TadA
MAIVLTQPTAEYEPWMRRALQLARAVPDPGADDPPVGAVVYGPDGTEIAAARHDRERTDDPTACAEILALRGAGHALGTWRLAGCTLVTTLEPGTMSAGAIVLARISRLVIGSWTSTTVRSALCGMSCVTGVSTTSSKSSQKCSRPSAMRCSTATSTRPAHA